MPEPHQDRIQRELFLATFGTNRGSTEAWVTDRMTSLLEEHSFHAGDTLFSAGDPPEFYYFLREGRVELVREGAPPWTYEAPSVFGMSDALIERPRSRTAIAITDIQVMRVQADAWIELLEDSFALSRAGVLGAVRAVAELEQRLWARGLPRPRQQAPSLPPGAPLDVLEKLVVLTEAPLLRNAGVQALSELAAASSVAVFDTGDVVMRRGHPGGNVFVLVDGEVEATRLAPDVPWRGGPGEIVCGTVAFAEEALAWEARALTPGRALTVRVADWLDLMEEHFVMVRRTLGALSLRRDELREHLG